MDYSLQGLVDAYNKHMKENYDSNSQQETGTVIGMTFGLFLFVLMLSIALWVFALVILIRYWNVLPSWAKVLGVMGILPIFPFGPVLTIIAVYIGKQTPMKLN